MSELFTKYPDLPELETSDKTVSNPVREKKLNKQLKKQKKLLKQLVELQKQKISKEEHFSENTNTKKNLFLNKMGDAFVKSFPGILSAVTSGIISFYFKSKK